MLVKEFCLNWRDDVEVFFVLFCFFVRHGALSRQELHALCQSGYLEQLAVT